MTNTPNVTYIHWLQEQHGQPELLHLLDESEQKRAASFKFDRHRNLYIIAHVFLRKVLSHHIQIPSEDWRFYRNSYGKPYIQNLGLRSVQFNLSHTGGMVVCAFNKTCEVGADVEGSRSLKYLEQMSRRNYTEHEYNDIFSTNNPEKQLHRFYTYWTLKESLVKALGCGLSMPLNKVGFIQSETGNWTLNNSLKTNYKASDSHYLFIHKQLPNKHQLAISVKSTPINTRNATFCLVDSNQKDSQQWKKQTLS